MQSPIYQTRQRGERTRLRITFTTPALAFMAVIRPEYFDFFVGSMQGMIMLAVFSTMMLIGFLWARSIVKVEV